MVRSASVYATEPKGYRDQPWFLNTAVEVATELEPEVLLGVCLRIEESRDRRRTLPDRPRTLDIDIILYGDRIVRTDKVVIPHPRYTQRRFVLAPLAEIARDFVDPVRGLSIRELLDRVDDPSSVKPFAGPLV